MQNTEINNLLRIIEENNGENILVSGFLNASMNEKIARNYIDTDF
jgi:hypothetical protein